MTDHARKVVDLQDQLAHISKAVRYNNNAETRRQVSFMLGMLNAWYDQLAREFNADLLTVREEIQTVEEVKPE